MTTGCFTSRRNVLKTTVAGGTVAAVAWRGLRLPVLSIYVSVLTAGAFSKFGTSSAR